MTAFQLFIILSAALMHASWNIASKFGSNAGYLFVFANRAVSCVLYLPWIIYLFGVLDVSIDLKSGLFLLGATVLHLIYSLTLIKGYQKANLSVVYPVARGSGPLLTSVIAVIILNESLDLWEILAILAICFGVLLISIRNKISNLIADTTALIGVKWGLLTGCIIASYSIVDAYIVKYLLIAPVIVSWISSVGGLCLLLPRVLKDKSSIKIKMKGKWFYAAYVGLMSPLAYILILYVLQSGVNVSIVAPLREVSMLFATIAGIILFKEKVPLSGWLGCFSILLGVFFLAQ